MKKILAIMMCAVGILTLASCDDDSEGKTDIIAYPHLTVTGDKFYISPIGQPYTDPGCTATYNGEDYTANIVTTGLDAIDVNTPGLYTVTYTATSPGYPKHPEGYTMSDTRTVAVCDPSVTTDLSGTWTTQDGTTRTTSSNDDFPGCTTSITYLCPGIFQIEDYMASYYTQHFRNGLYGGSDYAGYDFFAGGIFQLTSDNKIVFVSGDGASAFGDATGVENFHDGVYDPITETISYSFDWSGMAFHVVLKK